MCGIAGVLTFDGAPVPDATLQKMGATLRHRGPDADGCLQEHTRAPGVAFVHRRLSVIDLSHGADQPMPNEDGSVQVLFNGEIYNFRDLRPELAKRHTFRSQGDTEVIAHAYEERGEAIFSELEGMFAI